MDGILLVDKCAGMTSHDVVDVVRRGFNIKKAGHAGTLDPAATGLLVILVGKATKLSSEYTVGDKGYEAVLSLGTKTDSGDTEGKVISECGCDGVTEEKIREAFRSFEGETDQVPPMVSAIQHKGKRLYMLARKGKEVPREPRRINIKELRIDKIELPSVYFTVVCSKGTYIRKLCEDIGEALGCGGHMSSLRRISSGAFLVKDAISIEGLKSIDTANFEKRLIRT